MPRKPPFRGGALQKGIIDRAHTYGWHAAHFYKVQVKPGVSITPVAADGKGFVDLILVRERLIAVEVKGDGDRLKPEQEEWRDRFLNAGVEWYAWAPRDYPDEVDRVLRHRGRP